MEKKDYVSNDVAILLKEKGFSNYSSVCTHDKETSKEINIPLLWDAQKWLREQHKIDVLVGFDLDDETKKPLGYSFDIWQNTKFMDFCMEFKSYEAALNKGIERALKYI